MILLSAYVLSAFNGYAFKAILALHVVSQAGPSTRGRQTIGHAGTIYILPYLLFFASIVTS